MGRRRSSKTKSLPPNLYVRNGYFTWRDPRTGREFGIGRDRIDAIDQAIEANHKVAGGFSKRRLADRLETGKDDSVSTWCDRYLEALAARLDAGKIAASTHYLSSQRCEKFRAAWGARPIASIEVRDIADFLDAWETAGKNRMAKAMRSLAFDFFRAAQTKGWIKQNPVSPTKAPTAEVKRARLSLEDFKAIHAVAAKEFAPWLARAMELALLTGQRREDLVRLGPRDVREGRLWVIPTKTKKHGVRIRIPLELRLQVVNWSVGEVIAKCRGPVLSQFFIHHSGHVGGAKPGEPVRGQTVTAAFAAARDKTGRSWSGNPPSFHEIRSLAARLYHDQGRECTNATGAQIRRDDSPLPRPARVGMVGCGGSVNPKPDWK
ncbi:phage integrase Arm DNA-binding domain-containing protein [Azospirillum sp. TSA2s]|uniref:phage integrase Arm DNA-binding domain-containing protein n=1 Tax=Azospirillum sp. TSA2s TaxID=709810 RepID=UPI001B3C031D|nr:phage integrase Arm DNA-binding domain-containing protein [Azospirillum sp. TSA2s]